MPLHEYTCISEHMFLAYQHQNVDITELEMYKGRNHACSVLFQFLKPYLIAKKHKESQPKCNDEQEEDRQKLQEGPEDVREHHHENAKARDLADEEHEF